MMNFTYLVQICSIVLWERMLQGLCDFKGDYVLSVGRGVWDENFKIGTNV